MTVTAVLGNSLFNQLSFSVPITQTLFPKNLKAILTDLDGTLIEPDHKDFNRYAKKIATFFGCPSNIIPDNHLIKRIEDLFQAVNDYFISKNGQSCNREYFHHVCYQKLGQLREELNPLLSNIDPAIDQLRSSGLLIALCCAREHSPVLFEHLSQTFLLSKLDATIFRQDPYSNGAYKEFLFQQASSTLWVYPKECLVIGDSVDDVKSAKRIGMYVVGVVTGLATFQDLIEAGADAVLESFADLPCFISKMESNLS
jgi:phosphoglycolate phosphatase-like HAD superfamily hydrolase